MEQKENPCGSDRGHEVRSHSLTRQRGVDGGREGLGPVSVSSNRRVREAQSQTRGKEGGREPIVEIVEQARAGSMF